MSIDFTVLLSSHFERLAKRLAKQHQDFPASFKKAVEILRSDPFNQSGKYAILKLTGEQAGIGQWRLRIGRLRFRYDVVGRTVELKYCGLRRENTY